LQFTVYSKEEYTMQVRQLIAASLTLCLFSSVAWSQGMEHLKKDAGAWNAEIRMFDPGSDKPTVSKGTEHNAMLGDMWLISHFKGEMMGQPFEGASYTGFNSETGKYFGDWIDSMTPTPMKVEGTFDEKTKTLTTVGTGMGPDGNEMNMRLVTTKNKDGSRLFTMSMIVEGSPDIKMMEIHYTRAEEQPHAAPSATRGGEGK
jgi:hypothetical protein